MAENSRSTKSEPQFELNTVEGRKAHIEYIDKTYGSPESLGLPILTELQGILKEKSIWDIACACMLMLGSVQDILGIKKETEELGKAMYIKHYFEIDHKQKI